jgi:hypothetical protein
VRRPWEGRKKGRKKGVHGGETGGETGEKQGERRAKEKEVEEMGEFFRKGKGGAKEMEWGGMGFTVVRVCGVLKYVDAHKKRKALVFEPLFPILPMTLP